MRQIKQAKLGKLGKFACSAWISENLYWICKRTCSVGDMSSMSRGNLLRWTFPTLRTSSRTIRTLFVFITWLEIAIVSSTLNAWFKKRTNINYFIIFKTFSCLSAERADYAVEPKKIRDVVPETIPGGSTFPLCTDFLPKLLHDVTFGWRSNATSDALFIAVCKDSYVVYAAVLTEWETDQFSANHVTSWHDIALYSQNGATHGDRCLQVFDVVPYSQYRCLHTLFYE